jgi:hypothetical protein
VEFKGELMEASRLRTAQMKPRLLLKALCFFSLFLLFSGYGYAQAGTCAGMSLGNVAPLNGFLPFSGNPNDVWNQNIANAPVDPNSAAIIAGIPVSRHLHPDFGPGGGIPYVVVDSSVTPSVNMSGALAGPPGPNAFQGDDVVEPAPITAPIEGNWPDCLAYPNTIYLGDTHMLVVDRHGCWLYETYLTDRCNGVYAVSGETLFDLQNDEQRPWGWTSEDAAGLPVFAGLVKYDEATNGVPNPVDPAAAGLIQHAFRFTMSPTKGDGNGGYFVQPATHAASYGSRYSSLNVMGMRLRLKSDAATMAKVASYSPINQSILTAMQQYGLILADNGSDMFVSGTTDSRWNVDDLGNWHGGPNPILPTDFEVVQMTPEAVNTSDPAGTPAPASYSYMDANSAPYTVQDVEAGTYPGGTGPEGTALAAGSGGKYPTTGADTAGPTPTILGFEANGVSSGQVTIAPGQSVLFTMSVSNDSYDYIDNAGPVRLTQNGGGPGINTGSLLIYPTATQTYTLNSLNASGISQTGQAYAYSPNPSAPTGNAPPSITVTVSGSMLPVPALSPMGGTYSTIQQVVLTEPGYPQAQFYYTTDGLTTPTYPIGNTNTQLYTGPITIANATSTNSQYITGEEVQAIAVVPGFEAPSQVASATYVVNSQAASPTFSLPAGTYNSAQMVSLADSALGIDFAANYDGPSIFFTTDGTTPSVIQASPSGDPLGIYGWVPNSASTQIYCYTNFSNEGNYSTTPTPWDADGSGCAQTTDDLIPMNVTSSTTLNAIAVAVGYTPSAVTTAVYTLPITFNIAAAPASVNLANGSATLAINVTGQNGFASPVTLACLGLPAGYQCIFAPSSVTPVVVGQTSNTAGSSTLTISSSTQTAAYSRHSSPLFPGATLAVALCFLGLRKRRRLQMLLLLSVSVIGLGLFTGCSSSSKLNSFSTSSVIITVTGTSGSSVVNTTFMLNM